MSTYQPLLQSPQPVIWRASNEITEKEAKYLKITLTVLGIFLVLAMIGGTIACCKTQTTYMDNFGKAHVLSNDFLCSIPIVPGAFGGGTCLAIAIVVHKDFKANQKGYTTDEQVASAKRALVDPKTTLRKAQESLGKAVRSKILTEEEGETIEDNLKSLEDSTRYAYLKKHQLSGSDPGQSLEQAEATVTRISNEWKTMQEGWKKKWGL